MKFQVDSRKITDGQICVAIKGHTVDGHDYIDDAIKNGASKIIAEHEVKCSVPVEVVPSTLEYLKVELKKEYADKINQLKIIGLTGTNGKTTTAYLTYQLLNLFNEKAAYLGTIGFKAPNDEIETDNTTPDILTIYSLLLHAIEIGCKTVVMEVSSHALSYERIYGLHIDIAAFTNLTEDHLDYHKTMENYLNAKLKIVDYMKSQPLYSTDFTRKINSLEQFVLYKSNKNYSEKMYHLGYYYYYENELAKSVRTLQSAFTTKKKFNKDVYALLSRVYFDMNEFEKAQDSAQKAYKIDSNNTQALLVLGDLNYRGKDFKSALKYYQKAESSDKSSFDSSVRIAQTYEQLGKTKKALDIYERLLKTYNNCYVAYYKIALSDKSKELVYLKKAISINPNFKDAWIDLGRYAIEHQNFRDAKKYLAIANYIDENDFRYYYYQGLLAKKQGRDGSDYFKKSLTINPDYQPAKEELEI